MTTDLLTRTDADLVNDLVAQLTPMVEADIMEGYGERRAEVERTLDRILDGAPAAVVGAVRARVIET